MNVNWIRHMVWQSNQWIHKRIDLRVYLSKHINLLRFADCDYILTSSNQPLSLYFHYLISWYLFINYNTIILFKYLLINKLIAMMAQAQSKVTGHWLFDTNKKKFQYKLKFIFECLSPCSLSVQSEDNYFILLILWKIVSFLFSIP